MDDTTEEFEALRTVLTRKPPRGMEFTETVFPSLFRCSYRGSLAIEERVPLPNLENYRVVAIGIESTKVEVSIKPEYRDSLPLQFRTPRNVPRGELYDPDVYYIRNAHLHLKGERPFKLKISDQSEEAFLIEVGHHHIARMIRFCKKAFGRNRGDVYFQAVINRAVDDSKSIRIDNMGFGYGVMRVPYWPKTFFKKAPSITFDVVKVYVGLKDLTTLHTRRPDSLETINSSYSIADKTTATKKFRHLRRRRYGKIR